MYRNISQYSEKISQYIAIRFSCIVTPLPMFVTYFTSKLLNSVTRMAAFQRMRCLQNIVKCDDKELDRHTDRWMDRQMLDKEIPMSCYASQATQKYSKKE